MTLICYLTAGAVNLFWLILGDRLRSRCRWRSPS